MDKDIIPEEVNAEYLKGFIYYVRGVRVMLDMDLAKIYGYSTKDFNRQVKNNIEKFEQDFMFQLTDEECEILRCKNSTSSWGGRRYNPYAFKALIRIFKQMKDYIVDNQPLLGQREYLQLSLQTTQNTQDLLDLVVYSMTGTLSLTTKRQTSRFIIAELHQKTEGIKLRQLQPLLMKIFIIP